MGQAVKVEVQIRQPNLAIVKPEMSVKANFLEKTPASKEAPRIVVPAKAVVREGNEFYVWTVRSGMARRVSIRKGGEIDDRIEVQQGLRDGDVIVIAPTSDLNEGQRLRATSESAAR
jgi:hypothetical protein